MHLYFKDKAEFYFYSETGRILHVFDVFDILDIELNGGTWFELKNGMLTDDMNVPVRYVIDVYSDICSCNIPQKERCRLTITIKLYDN